MSEPLRPLPFDPARVQVEAFINFHDGEPWLLTDTGVYDTFALHAMKNDGTNAKTLIAVQWPVRVNGTDETRVVQLLIDPSDAQGLIDTMTHTLGWLRAARQISG